MVHSVALYTHLTKAFFTFRLFRSTRVNLSIFTPVWKYDFKRHRFSRKSQILNSFIFTRMCLTPNFTQIGKLMWNVRIESYLRLN